jgi:hypothetical protein
MNKITTIQKYAILWLNSQNNPIETIAAELKLTTKQIKNVIDKYTQKTINEQASPDSMGQNKQQSKLKDLICQIQSCDNDQSSVRSSRC